MQGSPTGSTEPAPSFPAGSTSWHRAVPDQHDDAAPARAPDGPRDPALSFVWLSHGTAVSGQAAVEVAAGAGEADYLEWPTLNDRILAWAQNDTSIVYDRVMKQLVLLPIETGWRSSTVAGPNLVWEEQDPARPEDGDYGSVVVLDITTLPVTR